MKKSDVEELLPFYVSDTLDQHERAHVEAELAEDAALRSECTRIADLARFVAMAHEHADVPPASVRARVFARISGSRLSLPQAALSRLRPVFGALAAVLIVLVGYTFSHRPNAPQATPAEPRLEMQVQPQLKQSAARTPQVANLMVKPAAGNVRDAQIAREGNLILLVDDVARALRETQIYARTHGAVVTSLEDDVPPDARSRHLGKIAIRVPAEKFDEAMDALARLGALQGRSATVEDIGRQIVDSAARLRNLRRTETDLLHIMDRSGRVSDILEVQNQLSTTREQIEQLDSELQNMRDRVAYASVGVSFSANATATSAEPSMRAQIGDAWERALRGVRSFMIALIAAALGALAFLPFILVAAGGLYLVWRRLARFLNSR